MWPLARTYNAIQRCDNLKCVEWSQIKRLWFIHFVYDSDGYTGSVSNDSWPVNNYCPIRGWWGLYQMLDQLEKQSKWNTWSTNTVAATVTDALDLNRSDKWPVNNDCLQRWVEGWRVRSEADKALSANDADRVQWLEQTTLMNNVSTVVSVLLKMWIIKLFYSSLKHKVMNKKGIQDLPLHCCSSIFFSLRTSKRTKLTSYNVLSRILTSTKQVVYYII